VIADRGVAAAAGVRGGSAPMGDGAPADAERPRPDAAQVSDPGIDWVEWNRSELAGHVSRVHRALERHLDARGAAGEGAVATGAHGPGHASELDAWESGRLDDESDAISALDAVAGRFDLSPFERDVLVLAAAVELDAHVADLVGTALDDAVRRAPTFALCLSALAGAHWSAVTPAGPLRAWSLVRVAGDDVATAALRVDERILHFLLGINELDGRLRSVLDPLVGDPPTGDEWIVADRVAQALARVTDHGGTAEVTWPRVHVSGGQVDRLGGVARAAAAALGTTAFRLRDIDIPSDPDDRHALARLCAREWRLGGFLLVVDADADGGDGRLAAFVESVAAPLCILGAEPLPSMRGGATAIHVPARTREDRLARWAAAVGPAAARLDGALSRVASQFDLDEGAMRSVAESLDSPPAGSPTADPGLALWDACRAAARPRLDGIAERIECVATWRDLVLPAQQLETLRAITAQARNRHVVYESWGFAARSSRGLGIGSLFAGDPGTGKTMAAEVLANELRLDLYRIDLAGVVSKYIGETEKNLRRLFDAAEGSGAILLFDEADALFGKRSEVHDSHDRYANIEVSYLLQRMEAYPGLTILTTNRKEALDPAFLRRLRFIVRFPYPDADHRAEIWRRVFPDRVPTRALDFGRLGQLNVAGGHIRNIALAGAFLAADRDAAVSMELLAEAARVEYLKLDRSLSDAETRGWT
jgi:hypothetical protein